MKIHAKYLCFLQINYLIRGLICLIILALFWFALNQLSGFLLFINFQNINSILQLILNCDILFHQLLTTYDYLTLLLSWFFNG